MTIYHAEKIKFTERRTDAGNDKYPFGLKGQGVKTVFMVNIKQQRNHNTLQDCLEYFGSQKIDSFIRINVFCKNVHHINI